MLINNINTIKILRKAHYIVLLKLCPFFFYSVTMVINEKVNAKIF